MICRANVCRRQISLRVPGCSAGQSRDLRSVRAETKLHERCGVRWLEFHQGFSGIEIEKLHEFTIERDRDDWFMGVESHHATSSDYCTFDAPVSIFIPVADVPGDGAVLELPRAALQALGGGRVDGCRALGGIAVLVHGPQASRSPRGARAARGG